MSVLFLQGCNKQKPKIELDEVRGKWELEAVYEYYVPIQAAHLVAVSESVRLSVEITDKNKIIFRNSDGDEFQIEIVKLEVKTLDNEIKQIEIKAKSKTAQIFQLYFTYFFLTDKLKMKYYDPSKPILFNGAPTDVYYSNEGIGIYKRVL
jgi:hypothetical protein